MPRKPPPTIYTCISEPSEDGDVVIRYSADPEALDSLPTQGAATPELVSKSRVAFLFFWHTAGVENFGFIRVSCRGQTPPGWNAAKPLGDEEQAMNWLIEEDVP